MGGTEELWKTKHETLFCDYRLFKKTPKSKCFTRNKETRKARELKCGMNSLFNDILSRWFRWVSSEL